jgi:hypothetical protein
MENCRAKDNGCPRTCFSKGQVFTVEVKDSRRDAAETEKADAEIYSKVTAVLNVDGRTITNP